MWIIFFLWISEAQAQPVPCDPPTTEAARKCWDDQRKEEERRIQQQTQLQADRNSLLMDFSIVGLTPRVQNERLQDIRQ